MNSETKTDSSLITKCRNLPGMNTPICPPPVCPHLHFFDILHVHMLATFCLTRTCNEGYTSIWYSKNVSGFLLWWISDCNILANKCHRTCCEQYWWRQKTWRKICVSVTWLLIIHAPCISGHSILDRLPKLDRILQNSVSTGVSLIHSKSCLTNILPGISTFRSHNDVIIEKYALTSRPRLSNRNLCLLWCLVYISSLTTWHLCIKKDKNNVIKC